MSPAEVAPRSHLRFLSPDGDGENTMQLMHDLDELEAQGPLSKGGFDERKCEAVAGASSGVLERDLYTDDGGES